MPINIPNILTIFRLLAAPCVGVAFVVFPSPLADAIALFLFLGAAITDFLDGWLARRWNQISAFGRMLDPIADKAMVVIALAVLIGVWQGAAYIVLPAILILFREVFVSGLREFLGASAGRLQVTQLAKWKTTVQMIAISALFAGGYATERVQAIYYSLAPEEYEAILTGLVPDTVGLGLWNMASNLISTAGIGLLWVAAILTLLTGWDYFVKALPVLKEDA